MGFGLSIVEKLSSQQLGAKELAYITFLTSENKKKVNRLIKDNAIVICSREESLEKEQALERKIHKGQRLVTLEISFRVITSIEGERDIDFSFPKNITRRQREFLEEFIEEAQQVIYERQKERERAIKPYAATQSLLKKYRRAIEDYNLAGCDAIKKLEKIFSF